MFKGFKQFILRGNVVDLGVGIVFGASFNAVVFALVKDLITPLIAGVVNQQDFAKLALTLHGSQLLYGDFLNSIISFIIVVITVYFFVVVPLNAISARFHQGPPAETTTKKCSECLSDIPKEAKRCAYCTSTVG